MKHLLFGWGQALISLIYPQVICLFCGETKGVRETGLCTSCYDKILRPDRGLKSCWRCASFVHPSRAVCTNCEVNPYYPFDVARAVYPYDGAMRETIRRFKYRHNIRLAKPLALMMLEVIHRNEDFAGVDVVIPVPLHPVRLKERGFNQAELLAQEVAIGLGLPLYQHVLVRTMNTPSQTSLGRKGRYDNLARAFKIHDNSSLVGRSILLVDDIYTTGATVSACAHILKKAGACRVTVITCAAGILQ